jgi:hypothetical protein
VSHEASDDAVLFCFSDRSMQPIAPPRSIGRRTNAFEKQHVPAIAIPLRKTWVTPRRRRICSTAVR